ncbi:hypothetical protein ONZ45_g4485 [Pleurotus djamor]|nr:hypothetical protein ONZ45_g4485 [Pleurotus djamor]
MAADKSKQASTLPASPGALMTWIKRAAVLVLLVACFKRLDRIKDRWYVLDAGKLHQLSRDAIAVHGENMDAIVHHIVTNLTAEYPSNKININSNEKEWFFNNAGGAMGGVYVIHASITEYLMVFGTPLGTEGHTGIHTADDYFNILVGEQWAYTLGSYEMERYPAGSLIITLCALGWIPPMLIFGSADAITSTHDYISAYDMVVFTAREIIKNLLIGKI